MNRVGASPLERLKRRPEFLRVARGRKAVAPGLVLQARESLEKSDKTDRIRVGFTASKKVGNAVTRNRARRRLKAAVDQIMANEARPGADYVVIARASTPDRPWTDLVTDLSRALEQVWQDRKPGQRNRKRRKA